MIPRVSDGAARAPFAILPAGAASETRLLLAARGLRAVGDGFVSLLLPVYLLELGHGPFETGVIATVTLAGSALLTLLVGLYAHRASGRRLLIGAALLMVLTGVAFAAFEDFWPLLLVAFVGTLNPSSGDVSVFLPLEQAQLARGW
jgi:MFS family permease